MPPVELTLSVKVSAIANVAEQIRSFELVPVEGEELPPFEAGAHISVQSPNGEVRDYSLINTADDRPRYVIAVKREDSGTGGSASMYDDVKTGDILRISVPRNHFPLSEDASFHLLIAGGIGITPILSMVRVLAKEDRPFRLIYLTRSPETTAFLEELSQPCLAPKALIHHDGGVAEQGLDLAPIVGSWQEGRHLYCCGPLGLMKAVRAMTSDWPSGTVHFEDFGTTGNETSGNDRPFEVELVRSGRVIAVGADETIIEALNRCGIEVATSCESGTCGTCMTRLLSGAVDHRDFVLGDDEREEFIMICVSRAAGGRIRLDL